MTTIELLQKSINYIEEILKSEIELKNFSEITGFSVYHFYRLFSHYVVMPVAAYITNCRLYHAIYYIQNGSKSIPIDLQYGFNTYSGFYKAFKREFGCSPTKYLELNTEATGTVPTASSLQLHVHQKQRDQLSYPLKIRGIDKSQMKSIGLMRKQEER